jgi:hypothetical protein
MGPGDQPPSTGRHNAEIAEGPASIDAEPLSAANSHATDPAPAEKAPLSPAASKRAKKLVSRHGWQGIGRQVYQQER